MPGSATDEAPALKALALSKLKCQVEELQQHNGHLTADNEGLRQKITALQQVQCCIPGTLSQIMAMPLRW
jgi:hypothetical protein